MAKILKVLNADNTSLRTKFENSRMNLQGKYSKNKVEPIIYFFYKNSTNPQISKTCDSMPKRNRKEQ